MVSLGEKLTKNFIRQLTSAQLFFVVNLIFRSIFFLFICSHRFFFVFMFFKKASQLHLSWNFTKPKKIVIFGFYRMLITLKTLQQKVFKVECELSDTVASFKNKIEDVGKSDHNGDYPKEKQKLIFQVCLQRIPSNRKKRRKIRLIGNYDCCFLLDRNRKFRYFLTNNDSRYI